MKRNIAIWFAAVLSVVLASALTGCQAKSEPIPETQKSQAKTAPAAKSDDVVEIEAAMAPNVKLETVREQMLPKILTATGKIQINEDHSSRVLAPLPGQVQDLHLSVGDVVEKDSILFRLKSREVVGLMSDLVQAQHDQALAEKSFALTKDLFEHQAAARVALQQAESDLTKAKAQTARAEEALRVLGLDPAEAASSNGMRALIPVRSPMSGTVTDRAVTAGQFVQGDSTPLATIVDLSTVWVMVDVFETDIRLVRPHQRVDVTATAYPDRHFSAEVQRISDAVDNDTRTLKVRLLVTNPGGLLKPGMFVSGSVVVDERTAAVTAPVRALFTEGEKSYVYVARDDRHFERRAVVASAGSNGRTLISSGLHAGERVVADGALLLRLRQNQQSQPE